MVKAGVRRHVGIRDLEIIISLMVRCAGKDNDTVDVFKLIRNRRTQKSCILSTCKTKAKMNSLKVKSNSVS